MKRLIISAILLFSSATYADGGCNFGNELIGKKTLGIVSQFDLHGHFSDRTEVPDATKECVIQTFDVKTGTPTNKIVCPRFYMTEKEFLQNPHESHYRSDYFYIEVYAVKGAFVELRLAEGTPVWAKITDSSLAKVTPINEIKNGRVFPANQIFSKPDRRFPAPPSLTASDPLIRKKIHDLIGSATPYYADFVYTDTREINTPDGTEWLKTTERFQWDRLIEDKHIPSPSSKYALPDGSDSYWTEPLRTVYIPVRDANGFILNIAGDGNLYCD